MIKKIIYTTILTAFATVCTSAQTPKATPSIRPAPTVAPAPADLNTILREATKQITVYQETFKDLLATETKTFEDYNKDGELRDATVIESNFLVYQSAKDQNSISELRNVIKVDDELVPDGQARTERFLAELEKSATAEKELEKIEREGSRYDKTLRIYGFTLYEGIALSENLRSVFDFKLVGVENYQGSEVYVVSYQQTKKSPYITVNEKPLDAKGGNADFDADIPGALKKNNKFMRGKLFFDRNTFQLWREERELTVQTAAAPLVLIETVFEYAPSEFGILVPKKISLVENEIKKVSKSDEFTAVKNMTVNFDYSKFKKTNVEVQILDDEN